MEGASDALELEVDAACSKGAVRGVGDSGVGGLCMDLARWEVGVLEEDCMPAEAGVDGVAGRC